MMNLPGKMPACALCLKSGPKLFLIHLMLLGTGLTIRYISAKVISNSVQFRNNYFMLDKGYRAGIKKDMGVVTMDGVVGIIIDVSENYSSGISLLHKDSRISGRIKKNDQLVNISWDGWNYRLGDISHIPPM